MRYSELRVGSDGSTGKVATSAAQESSAGPCQGLDPFGGSPPTFGNIQPSGTRTTRILTLRQELFLRSYLRHGNGARAAREAGYKGPANVAAAKVLKSAKLRAAVRESLEDDGMTRDLLIHRLGQMLTFSMADFISVDPETGQAIIDLKKGLDDGAGCIVKHISWSHGQPVGITLIDQVAVIERLARISGWLDGRGRWSVPVEANKCDFGVDLFDHLPST